MEWRPTECLSGKSSAQPYAVLLLNQPITDPSTLERLWDESAFQLCADGGANRLYDHFGAVYHHSRHEDYLPASICGDLDSLRPDVESYYRDQCVFFELNNDQESTDFEKCLREINEWKEGFPPERRFTLDLVVIGSLGGRVDQGLSIIHHLYKASLNPSLFAGKIFLFSEDSISFILHKGLNVIHTPLSEGLLTENVGIIPVGRPAVISTQGLEWDVTDWTTEIGGQVSTSNHIKRDVVVVHTTERVLFTVERVKDRGERDIPLRDITNR